MMKKFTLCLLFLAIQTFSFSEESKVKKNFERKNYKPILEIISSSKTKKLSNANDYRICGLTAFMFGMSEKSCEYYQKALAQDKKILTEEDLVNYAFLLLKLNKADRVLKDSCFYDQRKSSFWLNHLKNVAVSRNVYKQKNDTSVTVSNLMIDFLPQYGLGYFDDRIFFSYPRFAGEITGALSENALINKRRSELAGIKSAKIGANGRAVSPVVLKNTLDGSGRIATLSMVDKKDSYFATVVGLKGKPEQIVVHGGKFPSFPFNSVKYACAMPFYNEADKRLYFCSDMPGSIGGWDIYYSEFKAGKWLAPVNMGKKVNTPFDELFPSVYKDLLVFSSEAQVGLGGFDAYSYSLKNETLQNLWILNTSDDDLSFRIIQESPLQAIGVNGKLAKYYISEKELDAILNPQPVKPEPLPVQPVSVEKPVAALPEKTPELVVPNVKPREIALKEAPVENKPQQGDVLLGKVYYDLNSDVFKSAQYSLLDSIAGSIRKNDYSTIVIWSFTDRVGAEKYNSNLSLQRALGIREYLQSKFQNSKDKVYFLVAAGEYFASKDQQINDLDRRAEIYASQKRLPFNTIYAYKPFKGETLETISKVFNNHTDGLKSLNKGTPVDRSSSDIVYVGIQGIHIVSPGETLPAIAQNYNCSVDQLLKANHRADTKLVVAE